MCVNLYDSHTHSRNSHDGRDPVDAMCRTAIARGLGGIAVTDHCDIHSGRAECMRVLSALESDVARARERYGDELAVSFGVELGELHHNPGLAEEVASYHGLDFVIGSLHALRGEADFYYIDYDRTNMASLMSKYYDELLEMAETADFDSIAHINYQVRYMSERAIKNLDFGAYYDKLRPVLEALAKRGKGLEINTSSGRRDGYIVPDRNVVEMFADAGGKIITTGSDAHIANRVGHRLEEAVGIASSAGFGQVAFFEGRKPLLFDI